MLPEPVSILMPVFNEADIIEDVIQEWVDDVIQFCPAGSELVLEDCSTDGTDEILRKLAARYPFLRVNFAARDGFFNSAIRLYNDARCPLVFFTDSDGQYVPTEFWRVAAEIGDYDMVHGAKIDRKDPLYRVRLSHVFNMLIRGLFDSNCEDANSAFRLIRRPMVMAIVPELNCMRMLPNAEFYIRGEARHFRIKNIKVSHRHRKFGKSRGIPPKTFARECWRAFWNLLELRKQLKGAQRARAVTPLAIETHARAVNRRD
jgi:glycosyltransferase involved in cell wall biosynthesis